MIRIVRFLAAGLMFASAGGALAQPQRPPQPDLQSLLHLSPNQIGALQAMQAANRPRPDEARAFSAASPQAMAALPTPARIDRIGAAMSAQMQVFRRESDATRAFYNQLSPDQQKTFDQVTARPPSGGSPRG